MAEEHHEAAAARVLRTGIALVHQGELVLPAVGSEAEAERVAEDDRAVVQYHFPVEIEVRAAPQPTDTDKIADRAITDLLRGIAAV
jgi:hypothetical protein